MGAGEGISSTGIPRIVYPGEIQQFQTILGARNRILGLEFPPLSHHKLDFFPDFFFLDLTPFLDFPANPWKKWEFGESFSLFPEEKNPSWRRGNLIPEGFLGLLWMWNSQDQGVPKPEKNREVLPGSQIPFFLGFSSWECSWKRADPDPPIPSGNSKLVPLSKSQKIQKNPSGIWPSQHFPSFPSPGISSPAPPNLWEFPLRAQQTIQGTNSFGMDFLAFSGNFKENFGVSGREPGFPSLDSMGMGLSMGIPGWGWVWGWECDPKWGKSHRIPGSQSQPLQGLGSPGLRSD